MAVRFGNAQYNYIDKSSAFAEMGDRLATIDMGRKVGAAVPLSVGAGSPSNTVSPGPRPASIPSGILIHPTVLPQHMGRKLGDCAPSLGRGLGLHLTMWHGPRPSSVPSGILIHPTVWPQYTNVTDRQDKQRSSNRANHFTNGRISINSPQPGGTWSPSRPPISWWSERCTDSSRMILSGISTNCHVARNGAVLF